MVIFKGLNKLGSKFKNGAMAFLFLAAYSISMVGPYTTVAFAAANDLSVATHQGQESPSNTYTSGNVTTYKEGDLIKFRFTLSANAASSGTMSVNFSDFDGNCHFFTNYFVVNSVINQSGITPSVSTIGSPVSGGTEWKQLLTVASIGAGSAVVTYTLQLSQEAGECNGSSQHSRLNNESGDFKNIGQQNVPVPANQIIELPEIVVQKNVDTDGDGQSNRTAAAGEWSFSLDGGTPVATDANGKVTFTNVTPNGSHTIVESAGPTDQTFLSGSGTNCTFSGATATASVASGTTASDATCTFLNTIKKGSITIIKDAQPNDAQDFTFSATGSGVAGFSLDDDSNATLPNTKVFSNLNPGTFTFTEADTTALGWDLSNLVCSGTHATITGSTASIALTAGENVTCTYTNAKRGKLIIQKTTLPAGDQTSFAINASATTGAVIGSSAGSVTDATDYQYTVKPGTYSVTETVPAGWSKTGDTCQNVVVAPGETKTCVLTNTKLGSITIVKDAVPNAAQDFEFTATGSEVPNFSLDDDSNSTLSNTKLISNLAPGSYSFTELATTGWDFDEVTCSQGASVQKVGTTITISLAAGQNVTCTYKNKMHGQLVVRKTTNPSANSQLFAITGSSSDGGLFFGGNTGTVSDVQDKVFEIQQGKAYSVAEQVPAGWTQTSNDCVNKVVNGSSPLVNGVPTVYCDIVNTKQGRLTIYKQTDPGSDTSMFDYTDTTGQGSGSFQIGDNGSKQFANLAVGQTVSVTETAKTGWKLTSLTCNSQNAVANVITGMVEYTPSAGQEANCTYTNTKLGTINGVKWNDLDGDGVQDQTENQLLNGWLITLTGVNMLGQSVNQIYTTGSGTASTGEYMFTDLLPGLYSLTETHQPGWTQTSATLPTVNLLAGDAKTGLNFGNQGRGTIQVFKNVDTDGDGEIDQTNATDWSWEYEGQHNYGPNPSQSGLATGSEAVTVGADNYIIREVQKDNYHFTNVRCTDNGSILKVNSENETVYVTLGAGSNIECTFTNTRDTAHITVIKEVINDNSGTAQPEDFALYINDIRVESGVPTTFNTGEQYTIREDIMDGYTQTELTCSPEYDEEYWLRFIDWNDEVENPFTLQYGTDITCVITNDDIPHPKITVEKSGPENLQLGQSATYTFTVKNTGDAPLDVNSVIDTLAGVGQLVSKSMNDDSILDVGETWIYTATYTPPAVGDIENRVDVCAEIHNYIDEEFSGDEELTQSRQLVEKNCPVTAHDTHTTKVYVPQVLGEVSPPTVPPTPKVLEDTGTPLMVVWVMSTMLVGLALMTQVSRSRFGNMTKSFNFSQPFAS